MLISIIILDSIYQEYIPFISMCSAVNRSVINPYIDRFLGNIELLYVYEQKN